MNTEKSFVIYGSFQKFQKYWPILPLSTLIVSPIKNKPSYPKNMNFEKFLCLKLSILE